MSFICVQMYAKAKLNTSLTSVNDDPNFHDYVRFLRLITL